MATPTGRRDARSRPDSAGCGLVTVKQQASNAETPQRAAQPGPRFPEAAAAARQGCTGTGHGQQSHEDADKSPRRGAGASKRSAGTARACAQTDRKQAQQRPDPHRGAGARAASTGRQLDDMQTVPVRLPHTVRSAAPPRKREKDRVAGCRGRGAHLRVAPRACCAPVP